MIRLRNYHSLRSPFDSAQGDELYSISTGGQQEHRTFTQTRSPRPPTEKQVSVFAWAIGVTPGQVVLSQTGGANWLYTDSSDGSLMTDLQSSGRSAVPLRSRTIITDGYWHRIGFVWDGSNRILYVDGVAAAQDTQPDLGGSTNGLYIGCGKAMEAGTYWSGLIDDVRIYNRIVSP